MFKKNSEIVCVDATHGTSIYKGMILVTVLVIDQFGKGFHAAWLITKSENEATMTNFFKELKSK